MNGEADSALHPTTWIPATDGPRTTPATRMGDISPPAHTLPPIITFADICPLITQIEPQTLLLIHNP